MRSVSSALLVLEAVAEHQPIGLSALARTLGMPKTTVQRSLATLAEHGWLEVDKQTGGWQVGVRAFIVGSAVGARAGLRAAAIQTLNALGAEVGETVHLMVPHGREVVLVERVDSPHPVRAVAPLGARGPLHATSNGKSVLATMPPEEVETYIAAGLTAKTPRTMVDADELRADLRHVRARGYATCLEENEIGVVSVAAAIRSGDDRPVASLSISGPKARMQVKLLASYGQRVRQAAQEIARKLPGTAEHP